jgi:hypothetical protein
MTSTLLFPSNPLDPRAVDEFYAEEFQAFRAAGASCVLFSLEDFERGSFRARPAVPAGQQVLYRGWMMTPESYSRLFTAIAATGASARTTPDQYRLCHHLPAWYPLCADVTPETIVLRRDADFEAAVARTDWPGFFVKDYVKSLTTTRGSVAQAASEIAEIVRLIETYRGEIEGGVCVRRLEDLVPDTEERYFVFEGRAHARGGDAPQLVHELARRIESPFFSVDLARAASGDLRLIELGDGQVSDRKKWHVDRFVAVLMDRTGLLFGGAR